MPSSRHTWRGGNIPVLGDHSEAKHDILSEYIQKYLRIVCMKFGMSKFNITLVDGFAGGGIYKDSKFGSPLVMIEAVEKAVTDINKVRSSPVDINPDYFFIEKDPGNFESLQRVLRDVQHSKEVLPIKRDFSSHVDEIISAVKKRNPRGGGGAIFFLDQEGYSAVNMNTISKIRSHLPQSEIIFTFAISWLIDYINDSDRLDRRAQALGIKHHLNVNEIIHIKDSVRDKRNIIEAKVSQAIRKSAGFPFFRPFFIEPQYNPRGYWLLHLSPHYRAHNAMTETIWKKGNRMRHYGGVGTRLLELCYKGGHEDTPSLFGETLSDEAWREHKVALVKDLPEIIYKHENMTVKDLIIHTCNETAASPEMYFQALSCLKGGNEINVYGPKCGKKRSEKISLHDCISPQRQQFFFFKS